MSWYRDGAEIMSATSHSLQLVLDNVSAQHRGTYRCVASNLYGNESRDLVIFVQGEMAVPVCCVHVYCILYLFIQRISLGSELPEKRKKRQTHQDSTPGPCLS